ARGPVYEPISLHALIGRQNLFAKQVYGIVLLALESAGSIVECLIRGAQPALRFLLNAPEVAGGIEKPVGMIDSQAVNLALLQKLENILVHIYEGSLILDTHSGKIVDVEKAAVVDLMRGNP